MELATFFETKTEKQVLCTLCPENCLLSPNETGSCLVRTNQNGVLYTKIFGDFTAMAIEPIEKKPLFHFLPGRRVLSLGSMGCTLNCDYCQNWSVSQSIKAKTKKLLPTELLQLAQEKKVDGVCFTYNEPFLMIEYLLECLPLLYKAQIPVIIKTGGFISLNALKQLTPFIQAINLDLKGIEESFYQKICGGSLEPVLETARYLSSLENLHLEISHLIVPNENDQESNFHQLATWIQKELGKWVPVHLGAFFPANRMAKKERLVISKLKRAYKIFQEYLPFTYAGAAVFWEETLNSFCPSCENLLVSRNSKYQIEFHQLAEEGYCKQCKQELPFLCQSPLNLFLEAYVPKTY